MGAPKKAENHSQDMENQLRYLRADYAALNGKPFDHFFCPILFKDDPATLCLGHIVNASIPGSPGIRTVQRADVDNFFGEVAEADFAAMVQGRSGGLTEVMFDSELNKKLRPRLFADGVEVGHHADRGHKARDHTAVTLKYKGKAVDLVLHKPPHDFAAGAGRRWEIVVERDCRVTAVASLIKAAYLTMFRLLGYKYAFSAGGSFIGYEVMGGFFRAFHDKSSREARAGAADYFRPYIHMIRPIIRTIGSMPKGTINDRVAMVCFGSSGPPFAMVVSVKVGSQVFGVLMPAYDNAESGATYVDFLRNDNEVLNARSCTFNPDTSQWEGNETPIEMHWSKAGANFDPL
jgi:hypothetical protein